MAIRLITLFILASAIISEGSGQSDIESKCLPTIAENITENVLCIEFNNLTCLNDTFNLEGNNISCPPEVPKFCTNQLCSNSNLSSLQTSIPTSTSSTCICGRNDDDEREIWLTMGWSVSGILLVSCTVLNLILLCRLVALKKQYQQQSHNTNTENNYEMTSTEYTTIQQQNNSSNSILQASSKPLSSKNKTFERQIIETSGKGGLLEEEVIGTTKKAVAKADNIFNATVNKPTVSQSTLQDDPTPPTYAIATVNQKAPPPLPDRISDNSQTIPTYAVVNKQAPPIPTSMYDCVKLEHQ